MRLSGSRVAIAGAVAVLSFAPLLTGCGATQNPIKDDVRDPAVYGGAVKSRVVSYLDRIRKNPRMGEAQSGYLVEFLQTSQGKSAPVGDHKETYDQLLAACEELHAIYGGTATGDKQAKSAEIVELAKQLPGNLNPGAYD